MGRTAESAAPLKSLAPCALFPWHMPGLLPAALAARPRWPCLRPVLIKGDVVPDFGDLEVVGALLLKLGRLQARRPLQGSAPGHRSRGWAILSPLQLRWQAVAFRCEIPSTGALHGGGPAAHLLPIGQVVEVVYIGDACVGALLPDLLVVVAVGAGGDDLGWGASSGGQQWGDGTGWHEDSASQGGKQCAGVGARNRSRPASMVRRKLFRRKSTA